MGGRFAVWALVVSVLFLAFGGLFGGWAAAVARLSGHHWAWTGTLLLGVVLMLWLAVQAWMIGFAWPIQFVTADNAVAIVVLASLPTVRRRFVAAGFGVERATSRRTT